MKTETFFRIPFPVEAIRVTDENMEDVAKWCGGKVDTVIQSGRAVKFIQVDVKNPMTERQKKAYVGDWVLYAGKGWKCYTNKAFHGCFKQPSGEELLNSLPRDQEPLPIEIPAATRQAALKEAANFKNAPLLAH